MFHQSTIANAVESTRRPATRIAALAALLLVACCFARSDARIETDPANALALSHIAGSWYSPGAAPYSRFATRDGRSAGIVASVKAMLLTPKIDGVLAIGARVSPLRIDTEMHARRVAVAVAPEIRLSAHLAPGARRTLRGGTPEIAWVTERVTLWNDIVVDRQVVSREVVRRGTPALVSEGTPRTLAQLRTYSKFRGVAAAMTMVATAYTADTATAYPTGYTATGVLAHEGIVAVDPHVIPLGTMLFVPGYGVAVAADTGGAIVGNRIDLCMDRYDDAVNFGRQTVLVYILKR
jgi:3D (Asp-Asp-Asp) domain-containing protein